MSILHKDQFTFVIISCSLLLRMKNVSDKSCKENQNMHIMFNNYFNNCTVHDITWKNTLELGRPQIIWYMCIACCIPKGANAQADCIILIAFPLQQCLYECASMLCMSCWNLENLVSCILRFILWRAVQFWWDLACVSKSRRHLAFKNVAPVAFVIWYNHQGVCGWTFQNFFNWIVSGQ
jgi:hypothetical protein